MIPAVMSDDGRISVPDPTVDPVRTSQSTAVDLPSVACCVSAA
jgi:hypothetical protein